MQRTAAPERGAGHLEQIVPCPAIREKVRCHDANQYYAHRACGMFSVKETSPLVANSL